MKQKTMTDAARIEQLRVALSIIRTWASVPGALVPQHVIDLADRTLTETGPGEKATKQGSHA